MGSIFNFLILQTPIIIHCSFGRVTTTTSSQACLATGSTTWPGVTVREACQLASLKVHAHAFKFQLVHATSSASSVGVRLPALRTADDHCVSAPLDLPMSLAKTTSADSTSMLALHQQLKEQHHVEWLRILEKASDASELVKATGDSDNALTHRARVIAKFAPSTLASYFRCWYQWTDFCQCHEANPYQPPSVLLADFLQVSSRRSALGVATAHSRALIWMSKYAGFPSLKQALDAPITRAYTIPSEVVPRREAAPLPLSFVVHLESCILKDLGTPADRLIMGSILVLIWASLRWSDALWVAPGDLVEDVDTIRGVANKTKTPSRGMPFALVKSGFLGVNSSVSWSTKWLNLVRQALQRTMGSFPWIQARFFAATMWPQLGAPHFLSTFAPFSWCFTVEEPPQTVPQGGISAEYWSSLSEDDYVELGQTDRCSRRTSHGARAPSTVRSKIQRGSIRTR